MGRRKKYTGVALNNQLGGEISRNGSHPHCHRSDCCIRRRRVYGRLARCMCHNVDRRHRTVEGGGDGGPNNFGYELLLRCFRLHTDDEDEKRRRRGMMW